MKIYQIPLENMPQFSAKIDKLSKRAEKLGLVGPSVTDATPWMQSYDGGYIEIVRVEMEIGEEVKVQGWQFIAKIEHLPNGNIVKAFSEVSPKWRDAGPNCEHCGLNRRRNVTYVLNGPYSQIQVGSTCLKDFTGHADAEAVAAYFEQIQEFVAEDELEYDPDKSYHSKNVKVSTYLAYAAMSVRESGYVSRKRAEYGECVATADDALFLMTTKDSPSEKDWDLSAAVAAYVQALEATNDFEYNVKILVEAEYAHFNNVGYVAGGLAAYLHNEDAKRRGAGKEYVGTVKKREDFVLTLTNERHFDGQFGMTYLYSFTDAEDNNIVWFASKDCELEVDTTYTIKGTVKAHKPYNNAPQTVLTRCKVQ